jgi:hypothetical protein
MHPRMAREAKKEWDSEDTQRLVDRTHRASGKISCEPAPSRQEVSQMRFELMRTEPPSTWLPPMPIRQR